MTFKDRKEDINAVYKTADGIDLPVKLFLPNRKNNKNKSVLLIHGGGWLDARVDNSSWNGGWLCNNAKYLAENGFLSIVISYRSLKVSDKLKVPDLLNDCGDAIKYIHRNFDFVNFDDMTYIGESAGGYLAVMLGLSQDEQLRPKKVVAANPVLGKLESDWKYGFEGCEDIKRFMPENCIGEIASDFLFLHGTDDTVVKFEDTKKFHQSLVAYGHNSKLIEICGEQHAFMLYDYRKSDDFVTDIMDKIIDFII